MDTHSEEALTYATPTDEIVAAVCGILLVYNSLPLADLLRLVRARTGRAVSKEELQAALSVGVLKGFIGYDSDHTKFVRITRTGITVFQRAE